MGNERLYATVAIRAAKRAGNFIRNNLGRVKTTSYKGAINIVTDIDRKAEEIIIREIKRSFPGHSILAEERGKAASGGDYNWVIDPLDGTTNFLRLFPFFCVSIALERKKEVLIAAVYDPVRDELFFARKGKGAYRNKKKISVSMRHEKRGSP